ncbi:MAG TPA: DUF371 domain-containing protein [Candidatus Sulfopaludibacter sp.]|nr:DUF371 domain-containing protein [Candidatus Sulfopaludibacter sp.]
MITEEIIFKGHTNVQSLHSRTIEITKDKDLTLNGDCIIGVNANKSCRDLSTEIKEKIKKNNSLIEVEIIVEPYSFVIKGNGNDNLLLSNHEDIVLRKSKFICDRTLSINCDFSSLDIPRNIINILKNPSNIGIMQIRVE